jgi:hypothetical protein
MGCCLSRLGYVQSRCKLNEVVRRWQSYKNTRASPSMDVYHVLPEQFVVALAEVPVYALFRRRPPEVNKRELVEVDRSLWPTKRSRLFHKQDVLRQSRLRRSESPRTPKPRAKLRLPMTSGDPGLAGNKFPALLNVLGRGLISSARWSNSQTPSIFPRDISPGGTRR